MSSRRKKHCGGRWRLGVWVVLLSAFFGGCGRNSPVFISESQEIAMGEEAAPEFEKEFGGRVEDATLQIYVDQIGQSLAKKSGRDLPYEFTLVRSETPNAFALPGGKIFITTGLMKLMTNERQMAAVLGHEIGHCAARHNVRQVQRQLGTAILIELGGALAGEHEETAKNAGKILGAVVNTRYSRDDEYEADQLGLQIMTRAGRNPYGMVELLEVLQNAHDAQPSAVSEMFSTHPLTRKRIDEAREMILERPDWNAHSSDRPDPNAARFDLMKSRLIRYAQANPLPPKKDEDKK